MTLHLIKLCVGVDSVEDLESYRAADLARAKAAGEAPVSRHVTRMTPKQAEDVLDGGSLYWVIKRVIQCRQRILSLDEVTGRDGIKRCAIVMDPEIVRTAPAPRRPFQGWRYLKPEDAPADLTEATGGLELPDELRRKLIEIGAW
ncbi:DUF1489 family protein [Hyphobacterium marinum]|uniref:DUF1489 domain-containing protein n=1 Tax=Hyphobacterium marinum TaxID=3116574 RepID=A0ABU7LZ55_9PROT|nr:DUF1489 domain-containing protein [Hyphobacterium sp. Y6023]MEE2566846.1 DUF1489 domain-containing protein [Hyphobacterium sp. Y6023]